MGVLHRISLVTTRSAHGAQGLLARFRISAPRVDFRRRGARRHVPRLISGLLNKRSVTRIDSTKVPSVDSPNRSLIHTYVGTGIPIMPLPKTGTNIATLVTSKLTPRPFCFFNFLRHGGGRRITRLRSLGGERRAVVFCRSPCQLGRLLGGVTAIVNTRHRIIVYHRLAGHFRRFVQNSTRRITT